MKNENNNLENEAIKIAASLTKAPFKTAFMATLGVGAAQLVGIALVSVVFTAIVALVYVVFKS